MILAQVLTLLRGDEQLMALVAGIEPHHTGDPAHNQIVYSFSPLTDGKAVRMDRLEIHIIAQSIAELEAIDQAVRHILLTFGDSPLAGDVLQVELNGGGDMEDLGTGTYHRIAYYILTSRSVI